MILTSLLTRCPARLTTWTFIANPKSEKSPVWINVPEDLHQLYEIPETLHIHLHLATHISTKGRLIWSSDSTLPVYTNTKYSLIYIDAIFTRQKGGSGLKKKKNLNKLNKGRRTILYGM